MSTSVPIVVDLDGTLVRTDMLYEGIWSLLRDNPLKLPGMLSDLFQGKAAFKGRLAGKHDFDPAVLPYDLELVDWLKQQKKAGRELVLCTASDMQVANKIAQYLGIFDIVHATAGQTNLSGKNKAQLLVNSYGVGGFDYAANAWVDCPVWEVAREVIPVNVPARLNRALHAKYQIKKQFSDQPSLLTTVAQALRLHQWVKNLLVFVPLLASHELAGMDQLASLLVAFFAFGLIASFVYLFNDLMDLDHDRRHRRKSARPLASGRLSIGAAWMMMPLLLSAGLLLSLYVGELFFQTILFYLVLTTLYSWWLKRIAIFDCLVLALLYTLRVIAGTFAAGLSMSFWLLAFSVFLFLSLAYVKRYAELVEQTESHDKRLYGRGYAADDRQLVQMLGVVSGYISALVLALYINSAEVIMLYEHPELVWPAVLVILFWVSWIWLKAQRSEMHDDPLVFALKDKTSLVSAMVFIAIVFFAAGVP